jgi:hypothetical protein
VFYRFFPVKKKTAKYAGNWDPKVKQPWTLQTQKKYFKILFDQKYTGFDLRSMGRTIRELQIILRQL